MDDTGTKFPRRTCRSRQPRLVEGSLFSNPLHHVFVNGVFAIGVFGMCCGTVLFEHKFRLLQTIIRTTSARTQQLMGPDSPTKNVLRMSQLARTISSISNTFRPRVNRNAKGSETPERSLLVTIRMLCMNLISVQHLLRYCG